MSTMILIGRSIGLDFVIASVVVVDVVVVKQLCANDEAEQKQYGNVILSRSSVGVCAVSIILMLVYIIRPFLFAF